MGGRAMQPDAACCLIRHRLALICAGLWLTEIDAGYLLVAVVRVPYRFIHLEKANWLPAEGFANIVTLVLELDSAVLLDAPYQEVAIVLDGWQDAGERSGA